MNPPIDIAEDKPLYRSELDRLTGKNAFRMLMKCDPFEESQGFLLVEDIGEFFRS